VVHPATLVLGATITLDTPAMKKLALREVNVKEAFTLVDREGSFFRASLKSASGDSGTALVYEKMNGSTESPLDITLVCAVLSRQRMIPVVQKATELGVVRVVPVLTDHSVKPAELEKEKPWAWFAQAVRATRQCRRASLPEVLSPVSLDAALEAPYWKSAGTRYLLDDRIDGPGDPLASGPKSGGLVLVVGPEGGFSDAERKKLLAEGGLPLVLGTRVLRAETAVYAALAVVQHRLGDLRAH
jgi:16S rRNA (uracil1498-N3)-methyltransferase